MSCLLGSEKSTWIVLVFTRFSEFPNGVAGEVFICLENNSEFPNFYHFDCHMFLVFKS